MLTGIGSNERIAGYKNPNFVTVERIKKCLPLFLYIGGDKKNRVDTKCGGLKSSWRASDRDGSGCGPLPLRTTDPPSGAAVPFAAGPFLAWRRAVGSRWLCLQESRAGCFPGLSWVRTGGFGKIRQRSLVNPCEIDYNKSSESMAVQSRRR